MKSKDFKAVYANGRSVANQSLVIYRLDTELNEMRFGYSVSKKVGNSVIRHKITRRLREICRTRLSEEYQGSFDMVIIVRKKAVELTYEQLSGSVLSLLRRLKKYNKNEKTAYSNH